MSTINQEVLANQNATSYNTQPFHLKEYKPGTTEYWFQMMMLLESKQDEDQIKEKYADVFKSPYFADFMKDWVMKTDLPKDVLEDPFVEMIVGQSGVSLERYLQDIACQIGSLGNDIACLEIHKVDELKETVQKQGEYIINLENVVSELHTSVRRLQEVAFPENKPKRPTSKVGWMDRPVSQFNKRTGEFIRNWASARQAQDVLGKVNAHAIVEHLKRGSGSSGGYVWRIGQYTEEG